MRRLQLLETTGFPHAPAALHESITEILALALRWGRYFHDVAPEFGRFLDASRADRVLDCASGAGDAITILVDALAAGGRPRPDILLTDLKPNIAALERVSARYPSGVSFCPDPVNAAAVPRALWRPARTFINSLHHLSPPVVRGILADCARSEAALFVLEAFPRRLPRGLPLISSGTVAALANPLLCRRRQLQKALLTYALLIIPPLILADMFVSVSRVHQPAELITLVRSHGATQGTSRANGERPGPENLFAELAAHSWKEKEEYKTLHVQVNVKVASNASQTIQLEHSAVDDEDTFTNLGSTIDIATTGNKISAISQFLRFVRIKASSAISTQPILSIYILAKEN